MVAAEREVRERRGVTSRTAAGLHVWANWYILRTSHDFGWSSHWAVLNYAGLFVNGHKVLFDTPAHVRVVDVAVGQLPEIMRHVLILKYWWHRDINKGTLITDVQRAKVLDLTSPSQFGEVLRTAKLCVEKALETIERRRKSANIGSNARLDSG